LRFIGIVGLLLDCLFPGDCGLLFNDPPPFEERSSPQDGLLDIFVEDKSFGNDRPAVRRSGLAPDGNLFAGTPALTRTDATVDFN
jgi:hypothetical protein